MILAKWPRTNATNDDARLFDGSTQVHFNMDDAINFLQQRSSSLLKTTVVVVSIQDSIGVA